MSLSILTIEKWSTGIRDFISAGLKGLYWRFLGGKKYDVILLEYGIDHPGEMDFLLKIVRPNIGIMTKLDAVHSLQFGDPQAIAMEEVKMIKNTREVAYLNSNDTYARQLYNQIHIDKFFYRTTEDTVEVETNHIDFGESTFVKNEHGISVAYEAHVHSKKVPIVTNMIERHNLGYISMSLSVTDVVMFQLTKKSIYELDEINNATKKNPVTLHYDLQPGRFTILEGVHKSTIVDSSYNAAPQSVRKAAETIYRLKQKLYPNHKIIIVFGEMRELGDFEQKEHRLIAPVLSHVSDRLFMVGSAVKHTADELEKLGADTRSYSTHTTSLDAATQIEEYMKDNKDSKFLILLK